MRWPRASPTGDYAAAHTASDQAETVLYRLAVSPGSRALHGMAPRRGRLVRPLLGVTREEVREYLRARGLEWREDPSNADRRFARARVRHDVIDALRELSPAAERTIAETARQLRDEAEVLDAVVTEAVKELGGGPAVLLAALREHPPAVRRLVLRELAGRTALQPRARRDPRARRARHQVARPRRRAARGIRVRHAPLQPHGGRCHAGSGAAHGARPRALRRLAGRGAPRWPGRRGREQTWAPT